MTAALLFIWLLLLVAGVHALCLDWRRPLDDKEDEQ